MKNVQQIFTCMNGLSSIFPLESPFFDGSFKKCECECYNYRTIYLLLEVEMIFFSSFFLQKKIYNGSVDVQNKKKTPTIFIRLHL